MTTRAIHIQAEVEYVQQRIEAQRRRNEPQDYVSRDGVPLSYDDALAVLAEMKASGLRYIPCCEYTDATGRCQQ